MIDTTYIKMDYSLKTPEERIAKVNEIIANTPPSKLTTRYLDKLSDYIIFTLDKKEKKEKKILTENRLITVNKRETSFEGLVGKLANGEDGIYNMIANDKNIIFKPKAPITEKDLAEIPDLKKLHDAILDLELQLKDADSTIAYKLKKQIIEMRQEQYIIKSAYRKPAYLSNIVKTLSHLNLNENISLDKDRHVVSDGLITLYSAEHVSQLLCNYSKLKEYSWDRVNEDMKWMMEDLDEVIEAALPLQYPLYYDLLIYKIDGKTNAEIQKLLLEKYGIKHSIEYISSLWRNKIPKIIAETAENLYLIWYFTYIEPEKAIWKKCSICGKEKLAHNNFFSKNKGSKDGFYSICKECRNGGRDGLWRHQD